MRFKRLAIGTPDIIKTLWLKFSVKVIMDISISWFFQASASDRALQEAIKICAIGFLTLQSQTAF